MISDEKPLKGYDCFFDEQQKNPLGRQCAHGNIIVIFRTISCSVFSKDIYSDFGPDVD